MFCEGRKGEKSKKNNMASDDTDINACWNCYKFCQIYYCNVALDTNL